MVCSVVFSVLNSFPVAVRKHSGKSNLKEKWLILAHNPGVQTTLAGGLMWPELGTAAHITSTVRRPGTQNVEYMLLLSSSSPFIQSTITSREWCHPQWMDHLTPVNVMKIISHRHVHVKLLLTLIVTFGLCIYCEAMTTIQVVYPCTTSQGFVVSNFVLKSPSSLLAKFKYVFQYYSVKLLYYSLKPQKLLSQDQMFASLIYLSHFLHLSVPGTILLSASVHSSLQISSVSRTIVSFQLSLALLCHSAFEVHSGRQDGGVASFSKAESLPLCTVPFLTF